MQREQAEWSRARCVVLWSWSRYRLSQDGDHDRAVVGPNVETQPRMPASTPSNALNRHAGDPAAAILSSGVISLNWATLTAIFTVKRAARPPVRG